MPMWFDLEIFFNKYDSNEIEINCPDSCKNEIGWHDENLAHTKQYFGNNVYKDILKLSSPWMFKLPKHHVLIVRSFDYNFNNNFYPFPGLQYDAEPILTLPILEILLEHTRNISTNSQQD